MKRLELAEVARRLPGMPLKFAAVAAIGVPTGCRVSEILSVRRSDLIENENFREVITFDKLKARDGDHYRRLTIPGIFRDILIRHLNREADRGFCRPEDWVFRGNEGGPLSRFTVYHYFRATLGIGYGTHWMRKTFAWEVYQYYLHRNRADPMRALELTRQALGHKRIETTIKYLGIVEEDLHETQRAIFGRV